MASDLRRWGCSTWADCSTLRFPFSFAVAELRARCASGFREQVFLVLFESTLGCNFDLPVGLPESIALYVFVSEFDSSCCHQSKRAKVVFESRKATLCRFHDVSAGRRARRNIHEHVVDVFADLSIILQESRLFSSCLRRTRHWTSISMLLPIEVSVWACSWQAQ